MKRVVILVNKDFEYAGFIEGLRDTVTVHAGNNGRHAECRFDNVIADIYCIQNLFKEGENSSNSEIKYGYLRSLFKRNAFRLDEVDAVLSVSTSETTPYSQGKNESCNGCVFVGRRFFISDQQENDPTTLSHLDIGTCASGHTEYYIEAPIMDRIYDRLNFTEMAMRPAYRNSASELKCYANSNFASVGVVNVIDYSCYSKADEDAYAAFRERSYARYDMPVGIETTHGVVVKALHSVIDDMDLKKEIPVTFISPIVDRYLKFDEDVDGKYGKQNYICSYNGGVATGHILKLLDQME